MTSRLKKYGWTSQRPALDDYPFKLKKAGSTPDLQGSLEAIGEYQRRLWACQSRSLLLVIHGPDASGKDSLIRTLATYMDPTGFHAWSFSRPTGDEVRHDFLWRVVPRLPATGEVVAFNRSYLEAVMAERVWPVHDAGSYDWPGRYESIRNFECHLAREGTRVLKIWLNISPDEQIKRLLKRLEKPRKRWKFDASDLESWRQRHRYAEYVQEAIAATHAPEAPWLIIPGDDKPQARAIIADIVARELESLAPEYPPAHEEALAAYRVLLEEKRQLD